MTEIYNWVDDPTVSGVAKCDTDVLNDCLMHLKYNHKPSGSTRNIGDIFYTLRLDETLNGAYLCDGTEFMKEDFTGEQNPYELLVLGRIPSLSYEEYEQQLLDNFGNCGYFALDTINKKFKVPTLHQISMEATKIPEEVGIFLQDQLQEHTHKYIAPDTNNMPRGDDRTNCVTYTLNPNTSGVQGARVGDRTKSRTISVRFMVQLCTDCTDISIGQYTDRVSAKADEGISLIESKTIDGLHALNNASNSLNLNNITDCILEAPNGIVTADGNVLCVKSGLRVLIPNGLTAEMSMQNYEYTLEEDLTDDPKGLAKGVRTMFLSPDEGLFSIISANINYGNSFPSAGNMQAFFNESENHWYRRGSASEPWAKCKLCIIGTFDFSTGTVASIKTESIMQVMVKSDKKQLTVLSMPGVKYINLGVSGSGNQYVAPANGYFYANATTNNNGGWIRFYNYGSLMGMIHRTYYNNVPEDAFIAVKKGDKVQLSYAGTIIKEFRFVYAQGDI